MPDSKDSFVFYRSFAETVRMIPNEADQLKLLNALIDFGLTGVEPGLPYPLNLPLHQMVASVSSADKRYEAAVENGKKGGAPRGNQNARKRFNSVKTTENNLNENDNGNVKDNYHIQKESEASARPALEGGGHPQEKANEDNGLPPIYGPFQMDGKNGWYEYYSAVNGEWKIRPSTYEPEWQPPEKGTPEYERWRNQ